jgi:Tfp pilus assembly protein PilF
MRQEIENERDPDKKDLLQTKAVSMLEDALEVTGDSPVIVSILGSHWNELGNSPEDAIARLTKALKTDPTENRIRDLLIRLLERQGAVSEARDLAIAGAKIDPTFWRMQRHIARLGRKLGAVKDTVKGHYEAAIRHNKSDVTLLVEYGAFLFQEDDMAEALKVFADSKPLFYSQTQQQAKNVFWNDASGRRREFKGKVHSMSGAIATAISIPENMKVPFWKTYAGAGNISVGTPITFNIGFNHMGPFARILNK